MFVDFVLNNQGHGPIGEAIQSCRFDPGLMRPFVDHRGQKCVYALNARGIREKRTIAEMMSQGVHSPVFNATTLRKDEWQKLDDVVIKAARKRLRAWSDLAGANTFGGFNGMSKTILEWEMQNDPGEAFVDMDGLSEGRTDTTLFQLQGMPLPITHVPFRYSARQLAVSRNSGTPLDTTSAEWAAQRVAEKVEQTVIGTETGMVYGDSTRYGATSAVYGYTNFPSRNTKTDLTTPTGSNPEAVVQDVLEMRDQLYADNFFGPFILYHSTAYDIFMDNDYFRTGGTSAHQTLRQRVEAIDGISAVRRLDHFSPTSPSVYAMIMVQMTANVARAIDGMGITTIQWEGKGGMELHFKVMCIYAPQLRADYSGQCGILHGTAP